MTQWPPLPPPPDSDRTLEFLWWGVCTECVGQGGSTWPAQDVLQSSGSVPEGAGLPCLIQVWKGRFPSSRSLSGRLFCHHRTRLQKPAPWVVRCLNGKMEATLKSVKRCPKAATCHRHGMSSWRRPHQRADDLGQGFWFLGPERSAFHPSVGKTELVCGSHRWASACQSLSSFLACPRAFKVSLL